jgi:hypothetical protein
MYLVILGGFKTKTDKNTQLHVFIKLGAIIDLTKSADNASQKEQMSLNHCYLQYTVAFASTLNESP